MTDPTQDPHLLGRRTYDLEIAELRFQVHSLKEEVTELRADIRHLVEAWTAAKGMSSFVKWIAGIVGAVGIIYAASKGIFK